MSNCSYEGCLQPRLGKIDYCLMHRGHKIKSDKLVKKKIKISKTFGEIKVEDNITKAMRDMNPNERFKYIIEEFEEGQLKTYSGKYVHSRAHAIAMANNESGRKIQPFSETKSTHTLESITYQLLGYIIGILIFVWNLIDPNNIFLKFILFFDSPYMDLIILLFFIVCSVLYSASKTVETELGLLTSDSEEKKRSINDAIEKILEDDNFGKS